jgi:sulfur carrier protein
MVIATEINGEIIPKSKYEKIVINDGDKIEIVSFVGGG